MSQIFFAAESGSLISSFSRKKISFLVTFYTKYISSANFSVKYMCLVFKLCRQLLDDSKILSLQQNIQCNTAVNIDPDESLWGLSWHIYYIKTLKSIILELNQHYWLVKAEIPWYTWVARKIWKWRSWFRPQIIHLIADRYPMLNPDEIPQSLAFVVCLHWLCKNTSQCTILRVTTHHTIIPLCYYHIFQSRENEC